MRVSKFGGSTLARREGVENVLSLARDSERRVLVFSAIGRAGGEEKLTDILISAYKVYRHTGVVYLEMAKERIACLKRMLDIEFDIEGEFASIENMFILCKSYDYLISRGEYLTAKMFALKLALPFVDSYHLLFFKNGNVDFSRSNALKEVMKKHEQIVTCGFYGNENDRVKLLPRGGGDLSGAIFVKFLHAKEYEIFTDVDGIKQINPCFGESKTLKTLSYGDLNFMTKLDASVVHRGCTEVLKNTKTRIIVRNSFDLQKEGTIIAKGLKADKKFISFDREKHIFYLSSKGKRYVIKKEDEKNILKYI